MVYCVGLVYGMWGLCTVCEWCVLCLGVLYGVDTVYGVCLVYTWFGNDPFCVGYVRTLRGEFIYYESEVMEHAERRYGGAMYFPISYAQHIGNGKCDREGGGGLLNRLVAKKEL